MLVGDEAPPSLRVDRTGAGQRGKRQAGMGPNHLPRHATPPDFMWFDIRASWLMLVKSSQPLLN